MDDLPADLVDPHPARLDPRSSSYGAIVAAHRRAMVAGQPGYMDPVTGLFVFSAAYLWDRGSCCANACRHCPFVTRPRPV